MSDRHCLRLGPFASRLFLSIPRLALASPGDVVFATSVDGALQAREESLRNRPGVTAPALEGGPALRRFPYAQKVLAAAQVERSVEKSARTLVWLDAEALVLSNPSPLVLGGDIALAVRPAFLRKAVALPEGTPLDAWWTRIARGADLDPSFPEAVEPLVDPGRVRWDVSCGAFSVRPSKGLLRECARAFSTLASDTAIRNEAGRGNLRHVFLHQAVFSAVILALTKRPRRRPSL